MSFRIIYYAAQNNLPTGGNKVVYRHVDLLAKSGLDAWIYHPTDGFCYSGIVEHPRILSPSTFISRQSDIFVLPEDAGPGILSLLPGIRKIVFNQNAYYTFNHYQLFQDASSIYNHNDIIGALVVSQDSESYLRYAFPRLHVERVILSINPSVFKYVPWQQKKRQICFMTRKNTDDLIQVLNIVSPRLSPHGWIFVPIQGLSEIDVARIMGESMLFLSFNHPEGLSLSNLEALACGCYLIGYSGRAGREYFPFTSSIEVEVGDIVSFCKQVEVFASQVAFAEKFIPSLTKESSEYVLSCYSSELEKQSVLQSIKNFLV